MNCDMLMRRMALSIAIAAIFGCGGGVETDKPNATTPLLPSTSTASTASATSTASTGIPGDSIARTPPSRLLLEDWEGTGPGFLWQLSGLGAPSANRPPLAGEIMVPARDASTKALHISDLRTSAGAQVVGHHHFSLPTDSTITFWARSALSNPERLIFAVTGGVSEDFWTAQQRGKAWLGRELVVPNTWTEFRIPLRDLKPLSPGVVEPIFSDMQVALHFVTHPETFDFWIDDIFLECSGTCL